MLLNVIAYVLIPAYTIWFVKGNDWLTTNFSVIGNMVDRNVEFIIWGLIVAIYFFWCLKKIVARMADKPKGAFLIPIALILLIFAITTPYLPEQFPLKSFLHIVFAFMAAVCLMLCMYLIVWKLRQSSPKQYGPYLVILIGITLFSSYLLILAGIVSSALEIFFTISTAVLVRRLLKKVSLSS